MVLHILKYFNALQQGTMKTPISKNILSSLQVAFREIRRGYFYSKQSKKRSCNGLLQNFLMKLWVKRTSIKAEKVIGLSILLLIILSSFNQQLIAQNTLIAKYDRNNENRNNTFKQDLFSLEPNKLLAETIEGVSPGKALDVASGEGKNAIYLAQKGWNVTGFDIAKKSLNSIQKKAKKDKLNITTVHASRDDFDFGIYKWDLVMLCYVDIICGGCIANDDFIPTVAASIRKGGLVVYEMGHRDFYLENPDFPDSWGCTEEQLIRNFTQAGFDILRCDAVTEMDGREKDEPIKLLKFVARKR